MLFTSEQVSAGHPDKICDQISDAIVTDCLKHDRNSRVAVEAMIKDDHVYVAGEITSKHEPNISCLVRNVLLFTEPELYESFKLETQISKQSSDIALGVELEIMLDAATYLGAHSQPPPNGTDAAVDWWMDAAADIGAIAAKWGNHPLATTILIAIYGYLEGKAKAVTP